MENKKLNKIDYSKIVLLICIVFFCFVSIFIWSVPTLKFANEKVESDVPIITGSTLNPLTGFQLAFGGTVYITPTGKQDFTTDSLNACPLATIGFLFVALGVCLAVASAILNILGSNKTIWKALVISGATFLLIGGIMCFFLEDAFANSTQNNNISFYKNRMKGDYNVCPLYGTITLTCCLLTVAQFFYIKKKN